jgi:hypothetical protein
MTRMLAPLTSVLMDTVYIPLLFAMQRLAKLLVVTLTLEDAFLLLLNATTTMHVPLILATSTLDCVHTRTSTVMMVTNALLTLVMQLRDVSTFQKLAMTVMHALMILATNCKDVFIHSRSATTRMLAPRITATKPLVK